MTEVPLPSGTHRPQLLVVDFLRFDSRPLLTRLLAAGDRFEISSVDPVSDLAAGLPVHDLSSLATRYAGTARLSAPPQVVVGFCNAVTLAREIASRLGAEVPCVAVNPTWTSTEVVRREFTALRKAAGAEDLAEPADLPSRQTMTELLTADLTATLLQSGSDAEEAADTVALLIPRQLAWLDFLTWSADHEQTSSPATTVVSDEAVDRPEWWQGRWEPVAVPPMPTDPAVRNGFVEQIEQSIMATVD